MEQQLEKLPEILAHKTATCKSTASASSLTSAPSSLIASPLLSTITLPNASNAKLAVSSLSSVPVYQIKATPPTQTTIAPEGAASTPPTQQAHHLSNDISSPSDVSTTKASILIATSCVSVNCVVPTQTPTTLPSVDFVDALNVTQVTINNALRKRGQQQRPIVAFNTAPPSQRSTKCTTSILPTNPNLSAHMQTHSALSSTTPPIKSIMVQSQQQQPRRPNHEQHQRDPFAHRGRAVKSVVFNGTFPIDEPLSSRFADAEAAGDSASDYDDYGAGEDDNGEDGDEDEEDEEPDDGLGDYEAYAVRDPSYTV